LIDPLKFKAPFITKEEAWAAADRIRSERWPSGSIPVEVELILRPVGLRLDPIPSLKQAGDVDAFLTGDLSRIVVDFEDYMDDRMDNRMRFSIAHELGHFVLHRSILENIEYESLDDWIRFVQLVPEKEKGSIEYHANEFAGRLLVPLDRLKQEFLIAFKKAEEKGFKDWAEYGDVAKEFMANDICQVFGVSREVIEKRIIRERLLLPTG